MRFTQSIRSTIFQIDSLCFILYNCLIISDMDEERENETYDEEKYFSIDDFAYVCDDLT